MSGNAVAAKERPLSHVGRKPVPVPTGVEVQIQPGEVLVRGPKGTLTQRVPLDVVIEQKDGQILVHRKSAKKFHHSLHGLTRALIANAIKGVVEGYRKSLEVMGVGYRVQQSGKGIVLNVGFSHPVEMQPLPGVTLNVEGQNRIHVSGVDKQVVGEMAARIRKVRPPRPYKEKGIRYVGEVLRRKPGKAAVRKQE